MRYTYPVEEYRKQVEAYRKLEALAFSPEDSREHILSGLEERAVANREIAEIANTMIREYVETFEGNPEAMTEEDAGTLLRFLDSLFPNGITQGADNGTAYRIANLLLGYYRRGEDLTHYARLLLRCIILNVMIRAYHQSGRDSESPYAEACLELVNRGGEMPEEVRDLAVFGLSMAIIQRAPFRYDLFWRAEDAMRERLEQDPSPTGDERLLNLYQNIVGLYADDCVKAAEEGLEGELERQGEVIYPRLRAMLADYRKHLEEGKTYTIEPIALRCSLLRGEYHLGEITLAELLAGMERVGREAETDSDPLTRISALAQSAYYRLLYLHHFGGLPAEELKGKSKALVREVFPRILAVTPPKGDLTFNYLLFTFLNGAALTGDFSDFAEVILKMTVYSDKALYIHTEMVRDISLVIFDALLERSPAFFDGVAGRDAGYIRAHRGEMRRLMSDCCMFHDIGKFFILDIVENSLRKLTEDEFQLIRRHPGSFDDIYPEKAVKDEAVRCIRDCALTHHLWHDGSGGYPGIPQTKNRPFADILAVADSLDAATDFYGRPYKEVKDWDTLMGEFRSGAGTQYGPEAVAALSLPEVREKLQYLIAEGRKDLNYQIYAFGKHDQTRFEALPENRQEETR